MDLIYSVALLVSLVGGGIAVISATIARWKITVAGLRNFINLKRTAQWWWLATRSMVAATLALLISLGVHLAWGHRPGTKEALMVDAFIGQHKAFLVAALLPLVAWVVWRTRRT